MNELQYYENPEIWAAERYLENEDELRRYRTCVDMIPAEARSLVDVGAGNGAFLHEVERSGRSLALAGIERSEAAVRAAVCATPLRLGSIDQLPFEDRSFDVVSSMEVLEHLPYEVYEAGLAELERVAGRHLLVSVPYRESRLKVRCPYCDCEFHSTYHMRSFDDERLGSLFREFEVEKQVRLDVRDDYLFGPLLRQVWHRTGRAGYPRSALCPQCNYRAPDTAGSPAPSGASGASGLARAARAVLPARSRPRWIVVLYRRTGR